MKDFGVKKLGGRKQKDAKNLKRREAQFRNKAGKANNKENALWVKQPNGTLSMVNGAGWVQGERYLRKAIKNRILAADLYHKRVNTTDWRTGKPSKSAGIGIRKGQKF